MLTKKSLIIALATVGILSTVACSKSSNTDSSPSASTAEQAATPGAANALTTPFVATAYATGVAAHTSDIVSLSMYKSDGGVFTAAELSPIFATYSTLGDSTKELAAVNRAVITTDSHVELYSSNDLVMVIAFNSADTNATLVWSRSPFVVESILFASQSVDQKEMVSALNFNLKACTTPEKQAPDQGQGQNQGKDKTPPPAVEPVCQAISAILLMKEQPTPKQETPKQDQSPEKGQDKGQDKGKN